jgi:hypothetical protein
LANDVLRRGAFDDRNCWRLMTVASVWVNAPFDSNAAPVRRSGALLLLDVYEAATW